MLILVGVVVAGVLVDAAGVRIGRFLCGAVVDGDVDVVLVGIVLVVVGPIAVGIAVVFCCCQCGNIHRVRVSEVCPLQKFWSEQMQVSFTFVSSIKQLSACLILGCHQLILGLSEK